MAETPRFAHLVILLFLGGGFAAACCLLAALVARLCGSTRMAKYLAMGAGAIIAGYGTLWLAVAIATPNRVLPAGSWKYFCEADCHIAYSVESSRFANTIGPEGKLSTARGQFAVVQLKTWFDENSIAPFRGDAPLRPDARTVRLLDGAGRMYPPLVSESGDRRSTPLDQPLRPGESYLTELVFDVPADAGSLRLLISDSDPVTRLLIDHENSPLHGKIYLALQNSPASAAAARR
jgi:hypothetical protein